MNCPSGAARSYAKCLLDTCKTDRGMCPHIEKEQTVVKYR